MDEYSNSTMGQMPKKINSRHRALMRLLLSGYQLSDACRTLGYSLARASLVSNSPLFKEEMNRMAEDIKKEFVETEGSKAPSDLIRVTLKEEAGESVQTLIRLRDRAQSERVQQLSAIEILDRAGYKAPEKMEHDVTVEAGQGLVDALQLVVQEMRKKNEASTGQPTT